MFARRSNALWLLILLPLLLALSPARADDGKSAGSPAAESAKAGASQKAGEISCDQKAVTDHTMSVDGHDLTYTATAAYLPIHDDAGKVEAQMFFVAYAKKDVKDTSRRRLMFAFNGGPGASSLWLHLGGIGPKRLALPDNGTSLPRSPRLVDNESTWLDFTDLVFVDPVGTGYSYAAEGVDASKFYSLDGDVDAMARFIRLYLTRYHRWLSPKFLAGESYGATRASSLARRLQEREGISLQGVVLISSALDFQTFSFGQSNDLAYVLGLPGYTAAAWYHKKLPRAHSGDLDKLMPAVEKWSRKTYLTALAKGSELDQSQRDQVLDQLVAYTGLDRQYLQRSRLRVDNQKFIQELLRNREKTIGLLDARVTAGTTRPLAEYAENDPSLFLAEWPFVAAVNHYLEADLGFHCERVYDYLSRKANQSWKWGSTREGYLNVTDDLATAVAANPHLKVFMAAGVFDLTTPYFSQEYTYEHLPLSQEDRSRVKFATYRSGHQIYVSDGPRKQLKEDVAAWFAKNAVPGGAGEKADKAASGDHNPTL